MRVERFEQRDLAVEIAILAGAIGPLVVDKEEVVLGAVLSQRLDFGCEVGARVQHRHAGEASQPVVHRVDGDGSRAQAIQL